MIIKDIKWEIEYKSRQSGKTTDLINLAVEYLKSNKKVLFIAINIDMIRTLTQKFKQAGVNPDSRFRLDITSSTICRDTHVNFSQYDVIILDEFDYYSVFDQDYIITSLDKHTGKFLRVHGYSSRRDTPSIITFRDLM